MPMPRPSPLNTNPRAISSARTVNTPSVLAPSKGSTRQRSMPAMLGVSRPLQSSTHAISPELWRSSMAPGPSIQHRHPGSANPKPDSSLPFFIAATAAGESSRSASKPAQGRCKSSEFSRFALFAMGPEAQHLISLYGFTPVTQPQAGTVRWQGVRPVPRQTSDGQ
jgi:hypothetical protein